MAINRKTRSMINMFPSWMETRRNQDSNGARLLNVCGTHLDIAENDIKDFLYDSFIRTVDLDAVDLIYKAQLFTDVLFATHLEVVGYIGNTAYTLIDAGNLRSFYMEAEDSNVYIADRIDRVVYVRRLFDRITVNGEECPIEAQHVWNALDELGLLVGVPRLTGEGNAEYQARILNRTEAPGSDNRNAFINHVRRSLGLSPGEITVNSLNTLAFEGSLLNSDGTPSDTLIKYVESVNSVLPMIVGKGQWDKAYWDALDEANVGFCYLPHVWDVSTDVWSDSDFQSGYGSGDDVLISSPEEQPDTQEFDYWVGLRGKYVEKTASYPEHTCSLKLYAEGTIDSIDVEPEEFDYTIIASPRIPLLMTIRANDTWVQSVHADPNNLDAITDIRTTGESPTASDFIVQHSRDRLQLFSGTEYRSPQAERVQVKVELYPSLDRSAAPVVDAISLQWRDGNNISHILNFTEYTQSTKAIYSSGNNYIATFDVDGSVTNVLTAQNIVSTNIEYIAGTNDDASITISKGTYTKLIDTQNEWHINQNKPLSSNINISTNGTINLNI